VSAISDFPLYNSCKTTFFKTWSSNYTSINNNNTIINHNWRSRFHTSINCLPVFLWQLNTDALVNNKTYLYFMDFLYLLRYTVIIYKFTQGNLGAKKIARIRFQSPVKKKNRKLRHWRTDSATIEWLVCGYDHHMIVGFISTYTFSAYHHWSLWVQFPPMMYHVCDTNQCLKWGPKLFFWASKILVTGPNGIMVAHKFCDIFFMKKRHQISKYKQFSG
jgi:hypothetical protein